MESLHRKLGDKKGKSPQETSFFFKKGFHSLASLALVSLASGCASRLSDTYRADRHPATMLVGD